MPYTVAWACVLGGVVLLGLIRFLIEGARADRERARRTARRRAYARQAMETNLYAEVSDGR